MLSEGGERKRKAKGISVLTETGNYQAKVRGAVNRSLKNNKMLTTRSTVWLFGPRDKEICKKELQKFLTEVSRDLRSDKEEYKPSRSRIITKCAVKV